MESLKLFIFSVLICTPIVTKAQALVNPRVPAEWEELQGVVMDGDADTQHKSLREESLQPYLEVAKACIAEGINFYLIDPDANQSTALPDQNWDTIFSNRGIVSPLIHIIRIPTATANFPWIRDHGPYSIYENGVGNLKFAGYVRDIYSSIATYTNNIAIATNIATSYSSDAYYDGGNWLTDGHGTFNIANTYANSAIPNGVVTPSKNEFLNYMGVKKTLNVTGVGVHIDYWLKMINEETFIVSKIPQSNYDPIIDDIKTLQTNIDQGVASIKANLVSVFGRPLKFIEIPNAPSYDNSGINVTYKTYTASYTNSLIIHKTVIVPQYGNATTDANAMAIYQQAMPGYKIVGVQMRQYVCLGGALHCATREIYAKNPIYIKHAWLEGTQTSSGSFPITATLKSSDGINNAKVYWTTNLSNGFQALAMTSLGNDSYTANIPAQTKGTQVYYYISATNNNGKTINKPFVAPNAYYQFTVNSNTALENVADDSGISIFPNPSRGKIIVKSTNSAEIPTSIQVFSASGALVYKINTQATNNTIDLSHLSNGYYIIKLNTLNKSYINSIIKQ